MDPQNLRSEDLWLRSSSPRWRRPSIQKSGLGRWSLHLDDFFCPKFGVNYTPEQSRFTMPSLQLTVCTWKFVVGIRSFPFEKACFREATAFPWDDHVDSIVSIHCHDPTNACNWQTVTERAHADVYDQDFIRCFGKFMLSFPLFPNNLFIWTQTIPWCACVFLTSFNKKNRHSQTSSVVEDFLNFKPTKIDILEVCCGWTNYPPKKKL